MSNSSIKRSRISASPSDSRKQNYCFILKGPQKRYPETRRNNKDIPPFRPNQLSDQWMAEALKFFSRDDLSLVEFKVPGLFEKVDHRTDQTV